MMYCFIYLIIYLSSIIFTNAYNKNFSSAFVKSNIPSKYYKKLIEKYDISIQIIENKTITKEFLINSSYYSDNYTFKYLYIGKFIYLNNTDLNYLKKCQKYDYELILLIKSYSILKDYISNYKNLIKNLTKVIIVPKNLIAHIDNIAKEFKNYIYVIEIEEDILNYLINKYINNKYSNYSAKIISKKYELFLYLGLKQKIIIIMILLFLFILFYNKIIKKFNEKEIKLQYKLFSILKLKIYIILLLFIELNYFNFSYNTSIFIYLSYLLIIYNKSIITIFILDVFSGIGLFIRISKHYSIVIFYLGMLSLLFSIIIKIFFTSHSIAYIFFMMNLFLYMQILFVNSFFTIKNLLYFNKLNKIIQKIRKYNKYKKSIKYKLFIIISQFIAFIIYFYYFILLNDFILLKNELCIELEKNLLFESLEICFILIIGILYFPLINVYGFNHIISIQKNKSYRIIRGNNYQSNLEEFKNTINTKFKKSIIILKPKAFLHKNTNNNNNDNSLVIIYR